VAEGGDMESLGEALRSSRESQSISLDQIARDTRISKRYLEALEIEDFSVFPGEAYLVGFLRNYAQYLGLDSGELVNLYKNLKLQEQPIPMDELIHGKKKPPIALVLLIILLAAGGLGVGGYYLYRAVSSGGLVAGPPAEGEVAAAKQEEFRFAGESEARWFKQGDIIVVVLGDRSYRMEVSSVGDPITLVVPGGSIRMKLSEARFVDLNLDAKNDLQVVFNDIDRTQSENKINLWLIKAAALMMAEKSESADADTAERAESDRTVSDIQARPAGDRLVVLESVTPRAFSATIQFRGNCLVRYLIDDRTRDQRFFQKGETFDIDNVKNYLKLWISNAGVLDAEVESRKLTLGRAGQVVSKLIRWKKNEQEGKYELEVVSDY
jgi:cytoskeletal protein RodZ